MKIALSFCLILFSHLSFPQSDSNVFLLARKLTQSLENDSLKVAAIYDWVTSNIQYDPSFRRRKMGDTTLTQEPNIVIERQKAICIGYAKLVRELCFLNKINCFIVEGKTKNNGYLDTEGHAWNVVKINGNWYLLDATWGAADAILKEKYFLTTPSVFIQNHLPDDPIWQLLAQTVDFNCFTNNLNCAFKSSPSIFLNDTIETWLKMDSLTRQYFAAERTLRFNPNNKPARRDLADFYYKKALLILENYNQKLKAVQAKKQAANNKNEMLTLLSETRQNFEAALSEYQIIVAHTRAKEYTDAHLNVEIIEDNLTALETAKAYILKYFKN